MSLSYFRALSAVGTRLFKPSILNAPAHLSCLQSKWTLSKTTANPNRVRDMHVAHALNRKRKHQPEQRRRQNDFKRKKRCAKNKYTCPLHYKNSFKDHSKCCPCKKHKGMDPYRRQ